MKIYPNPTKGHVQIDFENLIGLKEIEIIDLQGKIILNFETEQNNYYIDLENLKRGVYILKCNNSNSIYHYKILKE